MCPVVVDGNFLAIGSHDNCIYIYGVSDNGRKYTRVGKCSVSAPAPRGCACGQSLTPRAAGRGAQARRLRRALPPQGHSSFITHLDWSVNSQLLVSNSGDYEILYCE